MIGTMRIPAVLLLATAALAAPDAAREWKSEHKRLEKSERDYWDGIQRRIAAAFEVMSSERWAAEADRNPDSMPNPVANYSDIDNLYRDYAVIQEAMGNADLKFAESAHPKALATLFKEMFDVAAEIEKTEAELEKATPSKRLVVDQRLAIRRNGLARREWALVQALAKCEGAVDFLAANGLRQAEKKDGRKSTLRRVAVIDALGLTRAESALNVLASLAQDASPEVRIAALEGALPFGAKARPGLVPLLNDRSVDVRRAMLQGIASLASGDPGWIEPVLRNLDGATGQVRADHVATLEALTNQRYGDQPDKWKEWLEDYRKEIEGGRFDRTKIEVREVERKPVATTCTFYGVPTPSRAIVFAIDGDRRMWWPADWNVQKTRYKYNWDRRKKQWEDQHESHQVVLRREFAKTLGGMAPELRFGVLTFAGPFKTYELGDRKLLEPGKRAARTVEKLIDDIPADGWCALHTALLVAAALGGNEPDTIYLLSSGDPSGGRYLGLEPALAAFRRYYRFRRVVVNALRICNDGETSEKYMQGLAKLTGGTYVWLKTPPARG